jgi:hypothetical protein
LNSYFASVMNGCMIKILEKEFIQKGMLSVAQDSANDVAQYCDSKGLKNDMVNLAVMVDHQIQ